MSTTRDFLATDDETDLIPEEVITAEEEETAEHQKQKELKSMLTALEETEEENAELEEQEEMESMRSKAPHTWMKTKGKRYITSTVLIPR